MRKTNYAISLVLNIMTVLLTAAAVGWFFTEEGLQSGAGNMPCGGTDCLIFFTNDSNILAALCALLIVVCDIRILTGRRKEIPQWAFLCKYIGTTAVTLTLTVVLLYLGPVIGYAAMFEDNCLALHLICPLLSIISFCFFESGEAISRKQTLLGVVPTLLYATVYLVNVIFTGVWEDFYHFNVGGFWYISYVVLPGITWILALILRRLNRRSTRRQSPFRSV